MAGIGRPRYVAEGDIFITGRSKDIIICAGRNIYPHEVEAAVGGIEGVRKGCVAAFGRGDPATGTERLIVIAETREEDQRARDDLRARIAETVADVVETAPDEVSWPRRGRCPRPRAARYATPPPPRCTRPAPSAGRRGRRGSKSRA